MQQGQQELAWDRKPSLKAEVLKLLNTQEKKKKSKSSILAAILT